MAWPASTDRLERVLEGVDEKANQVKAHLQAIVSASEAGAIPRHRIINTMAMLTQAVAVFQAAASVPGLVQYAKDQKADQALDVAAEFTAMVRACTALRDWILTNFPKDAGSGAWLAQSFDSAGVATELTFSTAALAQFRSNANSVIATIN